MKIYPKQLNRSSGFDQNIIINYLKIKSNVKKLYDNFMYLDFLSFYK